MSDTTGLSSSTFTACHTHHHSVRAGRATKRAQPIQTSTAQHSTAEADSFFAAHHPVAYTNVAIKQAADEQRLVLFGLSAALFYCKTALTLTTTHHVTSLHIGRLSHDRWAEGPKLKWKRPPEGKTLHLPVGESNPGLPRDRRGYLPLYYRGLAV